MSLSLSNDPNKDIAIFINDFFPRSATALTKLSQRLGRPLRGILLVDAERKASGNYRADKEGVFEEIVVDFMDDAAIRKAVKPLEDRLLLVSCDAEASQLYLKRVIPHVPYINTPTESSLEFCTHKGKMREMLLGYDESISPKAMVVEGVTSEKIREICDRLQFPLIVKPTSLAAARLVNKVTNADELHKILETSFTSLDEIFSHLRGLGERTMVVEEFVEGELYTTDAYVDAFGRVHVLPFIHFQNGSMVGMEGYQIHQEETYYTLSEEEQREGVIVAEKAVHAVGLRSNVAHIELFHTANGWKIVELGARAGGWRQEMYGVSYGIDHEFNKLLVKVGLEPEMPSTLKTYCSLFLVYTPKAGTVESISGLDEARSHPKMYELRVTVKPGDSVMPSSQGGELLVDGLMHNDDHEQLNRDIDAVRKIIRVNVIEDRADA